MPQSTKHILLLSSWYPTAEHPFLGNFVQRNAKLLSSKFQVSVVVLETVENVSETSLKTEVNGNLKTITVSYSKGNRFQNWFRRRKAFKKGINAVESVDLIVGHVLLPNAWMFLEATRRKNAPLIWVEHGSYFRSALNRDWSAYERWLLRRTLAVSKEIVAVSEVLKADLKEFTAGKEITVLGNHIDEQFFTFEPKEKTETTKFLHVSTLDETVKNPEGIFEACFLLKKKNPNFELTVISDESYEHWKSLIQKLDLEKQVRFFGPLDWKEVPRFYHSANAFVLFSQYETFSIVLAEALSTGTPIISTAVGIAAELPDSVVSIVRQNDAKDLQQKMLDFMEGNLHFDAAKAREKGAKYHGEVILKQWGELIEKHAK